LKRGERVLIFPEGARSYDGRLLPLRAGVARLAIRTGAPICPVRVTGGEAAWNRTERFPRPWFPMQVHYCKCIRPRPASAAEERKAETERIMGELRAALSGGEIARD
jgi:1-acyl-sn-glycerol-3-phosphate acyltransferase